MVELNIRNYEVNNLDPYTSDFLNQITSDFTNNMVKLYSEYKALVKEYNNFNSAVNIGLDWLSELVGTLSTQSYAVTGYADPVSSSNMALSKLYGQFYIEELNKESKIGRYVGETGSLVAFVSNKTYKYLSGIWSEDTELRKIINNHTNIWQEERDEDELYISVTISATSLDRKANIIEVVPFAGTLVKKVEWKSTTGSFEEVSPNSKLPIQIVGDLDFYNEIRVTLGGVWRNGKYHYSMRYVDVYRSDFLDDGTATYSIGSFDEITEINLNDDYIREDLKVSKPVRIEILSNDESISYYDSNVDPFPIQSTISIEASPVPLRLRVTLSKTEGITPVIKYIDVQ